MGAYTNEELRSLRDFYRDSLLNDTLPFWLPRSIDQEHGGYLLMRDRNGDLLDDDKSVWFQGRFSSILGTLYNDCEPRLEWLEGARTGVDFLRKHCFDEAGKMPFMTTRAGKTLRTRRYFFSEAFAIGAFAQFAKATQDESLAQEARDLFRRCMQYADGERELPAKFTDERPSKGLGVPMIFLNIAQQLCDTIGDAYAASRIDGFITEIEHCVNDELGCVMECVAPDGTMIDHLQERTITPGHAIEGAWFILHEAQRRGGDERLQKLGLKMLDYSWEQGWDEEHGGIIYFRDPTGKPVMEYWHDMKFWWPHDEALIATMMAWKMTGDQKYSDWHEKLRVWSFEHFGNQKNGEWLGYLHRDGSPSNTLIGSLWKSFFHHPRALWMCHQLAR